MKQKYLNIIGLLILIAAMSMLVIYIGKENSHTERISIEKQRRMQYYRDSLEAEEIKLTIEMLKEK